MKVLEGAGVPYSFDREKRGYAVRGDYFMPAVSSTLEESLALVALAEQVGLHRWEQNNASAIGSVV